MTRTLLLLCLLLLAVREPAAAAFETVRLRMSDGVHLATDVHRPEDASRKYPVVLLRSPYNRVVALPIGMDGIRRGYVVVVQDTRGRFGSEGANLAFDADGWGEHQDGLETIDWVSRQSWCNGKIGTWGGSALSITAYLLAGTGTPHILAQHHTVGTPSLYHGLYHGGIFRKALVEDWLRQSKFAPEALQRWVSHPAYDAYWRHYDLSSRYEKITAAGVHIGGWFDIFAQNTIDAFEGYQRRGGKGAAGRQKLLMGPWTHGVLQDSAGELRFPNGSKPPTHFQDAWAFFDLHLKGLSNAIEKDPAVTYYVMGSTLDAQAPGNVWRTAPEWPPPGARATALYLHPDKTLQWEAPDSGDPLRFVYDPDNPVPTVGGPQLTIPSGPRDQRRIESRPDLLVFTSKILEAPLEITGRVRLKLWISSDAPDTDFIARLCDVHPDGKSYNLCEGGLRARYRNSLEREEPLEPGTVYPLEIDLGSTSMVFNRGHRLRLHVTSSSSPAYDPNPNTGEPFRSGTRRRKAVNSVHAEAARASHLLLPVMPSGAGTESR